VARYQWKKEYSVSVMRFDTDHQKMFSIMNELSDAIDEGRGSFIISLVLHELGDYARTHIAAEEAAMHLAQFSGIDEHIAEHRGFTAKIEQFAREQNTSQTALELLNFLHDWLMHHILETDRKYSEALNRAGIY
jgi:hemerythrin-like metal-binding protein